MDIVIGITGAKVDKLGNKNYVIYKEKVVYCSMYYDEALVVALSQDRLDKLLYGRDKRTLLKKLLTS